MTIALVMTLAVLVLAWALTAYELWGLPRRRRRCIVNLRGEAADSIEGVLWTRRGRWLLVKDARLLRASGEVDQADGELMIDRDNVAFIQVF